MLSVHVLSALCLLGPLSASCTCVLFVICVTPDLQPVALADAGDAQANRERGAGLCRVGWEQQRARRAAPDASDHAGIPCYELILQCQSQVRVLLGCLGM